MKARRCRRGIWVVAVVVALVSVWTEGFGRAGTWGAMRQLGREQKAFNRAAAAHGITPMPRTTYAIWRTSGILAPYRWRELERARDQQYRRYYAPLERWKRLLTVGELVHLLRAGKMEVDLPSILDHVNRDVGLLEDLPRTYRRMDKVRWPDTGPMEKTRRYRGVLLRHLTVGLDGLRRVAERLPSLQRYAETGEMALLEQQGLMRLIARAQHAVRDHDAFYKAMNERRREPLQAKELGLETPDARWFPRLGAIVEAGLPSLLYYVETVWHLSTAPPGSVTAAE